MLNTNDINAGREGFYAELKRLRDELVSVRAEAASKEEKHQASVEELQTINEELRLASESLDVHREELQALNEELLGTNRSLQEKIDELSRANGDLHHLMAATAIPTVFLDRELRVTRYTLAATQLFRLLESDLGRPLTDLRHDLDYDSLKSDAAQVFASLVPIEREVSATQGAWFLVRLLPYRTPEQRIVGLVLTCVDITERKQADAHRQAKEAAERINQARGEFLSRMSHELRTPLNAILGFGQVLELESRNDQDRLALGMILKAGRHLLALVDEVLDITRVEQGGLRLSNAAVELDRIMHECVRLTARLAEAHQVTCQVEVSDGSLPPLWTDEQRLRQVLLNLLTNAIKYNRLGGQVMISCRRKADVNCLISVRDTGQGIATEDLARLFIPFERLHHQDGEIEGTGLGLAITRRLVEALGGTVGVESELGHGSHFWVQVPWTSPPATLAPSADVAPPILLGNLAASKDITMLCIEDNASNLELVQMVAARYWPRWRFLSACSGGEGLKQADRHLPDLILLDLQLPDRPGDQVLAELRRNPLTARVPVVVLSADATAHSREKLLAEGAAAYVTKPFEIAALVQAVNNTMYVAASLN